MKRRSFVLMLVFGCLAIFGFSTEVSADVPVYRLYNPNSGEHFYTIHMHEKVNCIRAGWRDEGIGWRAPETGDRVFRAYNPNAGDHHYTRNNLEVAWLKSLGWWDEGEVFFSPEVTWPKVNLYRLYNPNAKAGAHHYTPHLSERNHLIRVGWRDEGIGFYASSIK
ncbi:hypothetical protein P7E02_06705 [Enterococcus hulanensis]|uniref:hypothetical protein n=1 Tax=Enterococcus TaxID=1350 RepID=UPI000B5A5CB0|nr:MULTISPECIES: hypothetical protein [Enterococcus]MBO0410641.1 hypothetical protein [Enterococcus hulanensis]MDT2659549.1 hypothetical protein [Enterococcus hulanensis]OTO15085.1 hypothetical protein A5875_004242 [Enterococcus sp. 3H8_DIV0648]